MTRGTSERRTRRPSTAPGSGGGKADGRSLRRWLIGAGALALTALLITGAFFVMRGGSVTPGASGPLAVLKTNDFHALAFSAEDPNVAYFGHHNGILRTADGGQTWKPLVDRPNFDAMNLAVGPAAGSRMYLAGHDIFQISTDSGATWQPVAHNLPGTDIHGFTMSPDDSNRLIAFVVGHGPLQSSDGGKTWQRLAGSWAASGNVPFASAGGVPEKIYAGSGSTGVVRSNDGGKTWTPAVSGLERRQVMTLAVDPKADQTVYAGTDAGLFKSTNGGISWTKLPYPGAAVFALALSPAQSQRILAISVSNQQGQVYRSDDGGQTWGAH